MAAVPENANLDNHPTAGKDGIGESVPVIDISSLSGNDPQASKSTAVTEIARACKDWGFFQVVNHGVSSSLIENVWKQTRGFFSLPVDVKETIMRTRENPWGFYNSELTKNQRDKKEVFDFTHERIDPIYDSRNRWLAGEQEFKNTMLEYFDACSRLSLQLLEAFCTGLDLPANFMHDDFETNHTGFMRLNYYPVTDPLAGLSTRPQTIADLGVHHHTDAGALTVLLQDDVGGLQVYRDGYWHDIPPVPGAFVINTGDMMQVWSNDTYRAAIHRGLAMESRDRYSIPFFYNPSATAKVSPLSTVVSKQRPKRYNTITWSEFRGKRTDGDYADYGAEVQISQFRIQDTSD
jgi:isopenicillin N synthase-like dioxygenase